MKLTEFKESLRKRIVFLEKNLDKQDKMRIAIKLKVDILTIRKYMSGKIEELRNLELAEKIILESELIISRKGITKDGGLLG